MPSGILYPTTRPDRAEGGVSLAAGGGALSLPRARIWPWFVGTSGDTRTTVVSQSFQTPCMIWEIACMWVQAGSNSGGIGVLYSTDDSGGQTAGPRLNIPSGTRVLDPLSFRSNVVGHIDPLAETWTTVGEGGTVSVPWKLNPKFIIDVAGPIFLKVTLQTQSGEARTRGFIVVFEGTSLDQLANFL